MARKQTRRGVSISRTAYDAAAAAAAREGIALAEWVTRLIRAACPELPETVHYRPATDELPAHRSDRADIVRSAAAPTPPPRALPSRAELDRMAAERKLAQKVAPGAYCANCIDAKATHRGVIDNTGTVYDLCDACELPARETRGTERGYEPNGGLPTAKEAHEGALRVVSEDRWKRDSRDILNMQRGPTPPAVLDADPRRDR